jgi:hypothetical protein
MSEPGDRIPAVISREAWDAAMTIDEGIAQFFGECGLTRKEGASQIIQVIARTVQLAINRAMENVQ